MTGPPIGYSSSRHMAIWRCVYSRAAFFPSSKYDDTSSSSLFYTPRWLALGSIAIGAVSLETHLRDTEHSVGLGIHSCAHPSRHRAFRWLWERHILRGTRFRGVAGRDFPDPGCARGRDGGMIGLAHGWLWDGWCVAFAGRPLVMFGFVVSGETVIGDTLLKS